MPTDDAISGTTNIREVLERLRIKEPSICSAIESYIDNESAELHAAKSKQAAAEAELARTKMLSDACGQSAVLLMPDSVDRSLMHWIIVKDTPVTGDLLETTVCIGHPLSDFLTTETDLKVPANVNENFTETFEATTHGGKLLKISVFGQADGSVVCHIVDGTTDNMIEVHCHRFQLIGEVLDIVYSAKENDEIFNEVIERVGAHFALKRILVFLDQKSNTVGQLSYQWTAPGVSRVPAESYVPYGDCPSWLKILKDNNMIKADNLSMLPPDVAHVLSGMGLHCICVFPLRRVQANVLCGSVLFEAADGATIDKQEIIYLEIVGTLLSGHITRKLVTDDLVLQKDRAEEADRLKSSFLVNVSRDIRIPMNNIIGFSDLLADEDLTQTEREEFLDMINKSGQDLITLIDNIIDISKIETGQMTIKKEEIQLTPLFNDILAVFRNNHMLEDRDDLSLQIDIAPKFNELKIRTDIFKFRQVFINIVDNAIKFTPSGFVKFGVSRVWDDTIEFYVQDTGIGIPESQQDLIFQRFTKLDHKYENEYNGTGLGLPICKGIIEMLGGSMRVVSVPGKGSTFYFTHPLQHKYVETVNSARDAKPTYDWADKKIAIVNSGAQDRKYLDHVLSATGISIVWLDVTEAVKYFEDDGEADVMLVELSPVTIETIVRIKGMTEVPIVAQSQGENVERDRAMAMAAGCAEYIAKPLNANKFLTALRSLIK
ncbi:MAG: hypothetical protein J6U04_03215 [Salinivirgaceae bacterium]|nr:hypothetical protein [Salinivirgaceae bacterium]